MNTHSIDSQYKTIQSLIAEGLIDEALSALIEFVEALDDTELQRQVLHLKARYAIERREIAQGIKETKTSLNEILKSLIDLLSEAKRVGISNANLSAVAKLEELTKRGNESVSTLDEVSLLMAESRLLEIEIFYHSPVSKMAMNEEQSRQMGLHIQRFKEILARLRKNNQ